MAPRDRPPRVACRRHVSITGTTAPRQGASLDHPEAGAPSSPARGLKRRGCPITDHIGVDLIRPHAITKGWFAPAVIESLAGHCGLLEVHAGPAPAAGRRRQAHALLRSSFFHHREHIQPTELLLGNASGHRSRLFNRFWRLLNRMETEQCTEQSSRNVRLKKSGRWDLTLLGLDARCGRGLASPIFSQDHPHGAKLPWPSLQQR